jgi:hypothetical protein
LISVSGRAPAARRGAASDGNASGAGGRRVADAVVGPIWSSASQGRVTSVWSRPRRLAEARVAVDEPTPAPR